MKKTVLITGASKGIGLATAKKFEAEGYDVIVNYNKTTISGFKRIQADISSEEDIIKMFSQIQKLDVLVNNAGISAADIQVEHMQFAELDQMFKTNTYSAFLCSREAIKLMKKSGGSIVNVTSEAAKFGGNNMANYSASKAAVNTLTVALAREVAKYNIRVNAVSPAIIDTGIHPSDKSATIPMGRMGTPQEVADAIFYLASDSASYISGAILPVTGAR